MPRKSASMFAAMLLAAGAALAQNGQVVTNTFHTTREELEAKLISTFDNMVKTPSMFDEEPVRYLNMVEAFKRHAGLWGNPWPKSKRGIADTYEVIREGVEKKLTPERYARYESYWLKEMESGEYWKQPLAFDALVCGLGSAAGKDIALKRVRKLMEERDKLLTDDEEYRAAVMFYSTALAFLGDRTAEPLLIGMAENTAEETVMRVKAVRALDFIRSDGALRKLTSAGDCAVAAEAYKALSSRRIWDRREARDEELAKQALKRLEEVYSAFCRDKGFCKNSESLALAIVCDVFAGVESGDAPFATSEFLADMHRIMEPIALGWADINDWRTKSLAEFMMKPLLGKGTDDFFMKCMRLKDDSIRTHAVVAYAHANQPQTLESKRDVFLKLMDSPNRSLSISALCALRKSFDEKKPWRGRVVIVPDEEISREKERVRKLCTERK